MRIRSVKPEFFTDRVTGRWPFDLMIFYEALWCLADDEGRFEWEPEAIRGRLFPFKPDLDVNSLLEQLVAAGRARRYEVGDASFGVLLKFKKHQRPNRPVASKLPPPPFTVDSVSEQGGLTPVVESSGEESSGDGEEDLAEDKPRRRGRSLADPRLRPLTDRLVAIFKEVRGAKYKHSGAKDAQALKSLLAVATDAEIEFRWRLALNASGWTRCNTFAQLSMKWNDLAPPGARAASNQPTIVQFDREKNELVMSDGSRRKAG